MAVSLLIVCAIAVTFFWRAMGAFAAGRVRAHSPLFNATACITYAMVGALIAKLVIYPQGAAADAALLHRLLAIAGTLAVYAASRNVASAAWCGAAALFLLHSQMTD